MKFDDRTHCLVTGGTGFIGSHLCEHLLSLGCHVICVDNMYTGTLKNIERFLECPRFQYISMNVIDITPDNIPRPVHCIFHLACPASPPKYQADAVGTLRTCFEGTFKVLEYARGHSPLYATPRLIFSSTSEVYGDPQESPQKESYRGNVSCTGPRSCYDEGKRVAETLIINYCSGSTSASASSAPKISYGIVRIFNTYGPNMAGDDGRVVTNFLRQAQAGVPLTIYGSGQQTRSFCYVTDLVEGLMRMAQSGESGPINLGNTEEVTIVGIARLILELTGSQSPIEHLPAAEDDPSCRCPDISVAQQLLEWTPTVSLRSGLKRLL